MAFLRRATKHDSIEINNFFLVVYSSFATGKESKW